ncbi:MAG: hypothetical protein AB1798_05815 [Spirochaetota bacterium]
MDRFTAEQKIYKIGKREIGGRPGELPTVLIGSIFFEGHRIVSDPVKGLFDREKARILLEKAKDASLKNGNPGFIDVIGGTYEALIKYTEFVAAKSDEPILIDSFSQKVRMEALKYFSDSEITERLIYNSSAEDFTEEELACIKESGVKSAVIMAFSPKALKPQSRITLLKEKLLPAARRPTPFSPGKSFEARRNLFSSR